MSYQTQKPDFEWIPDDLPGLDTYIKGLQHDAAALQTKLHTAFLKRHKLKLQAQYRQQEQEQSHELP